MAAEGRVVALDPEDAWSLLPDTGLGRVLYTKSALPAVRLLPFALHGRAMILPLDVMSRAQLCCVIGSATAVEVDDPQRGWTVTVAGPVHGTTNVDGLDLASDPDLARWLDGSPTSYIRVEAAIVYGLQCSVDLAPPFARPDGRSVRVADR